ncbi:transcriptional regulator [Methylopila capsulata]|uniref:Transcriptional regulator n=1 Tax=Methylopila capsulata TaxID=61654 RepID=A0A9W6MSS6_9HYPH|nr:transcriptional regulator [Methylopila capsulata]
MVRKAGREFTIRDVARSAEVAVGTVSRVLNDHPSVTRDVRERVQRAITSLGYERNAVAQSMRSARTHMIACAIRDFDIPGYVSYVKEAERIFRAADYTFLLASTANDKAVELSLLRKFAQRRVDGVMMTISDESDPELIAAVEQAKMPLVLIDREMIQSVDRVAADHRSGARQATDYLLSLGHRRIALFVGDPHAHPSRSRIEGYGDAFRAAGLEPDPAMIRDHSLSNEFTFRETSALMQRPDPPTAIFVAGIDMLAGAMRALKAAGLAIGRDVSVVSGGDSDLAELSTPAITALQWDRAQMGRHAAQMLLDRVTGRTTEPPRCVRVPVSLVVRESCRPPQ